MLEKYYLNNWAEASIMQNQINSQIKLDVLYTRNSFEEITGYSLRVYRGELTPDNIIYCIPVESAYPNTWSLSTEEAITFLNLIGFSCEWAAETPSIPDRARVIMESLVNMGYSVILRTIRPSDVLIEDTEHKNTMSLRVLLGDFNYFDWLFLPIDQPINIKNYFGEID